MKNSFKINFFFSISQRKDKIRSFFRVQIELYLSTLSQTLSSFPLKYEVQNLDIEKKPFLSALMLIASQVNMFLCFILICTYFYLLLQLGEEPTFIKRVQGTNVGLVTHLSHLSSFFWWQLFNSEFYFNNPGCYQQFNRQCNFSGIWLPWEALLLSFCEWYWNVSI